MVNKTLLSLAVAASVTTLAGCNTGGDTDVDLTPVTSGQEGAVPARTAPLFSAANSILPINTDFLFRTAAETDGTAAIADTTPPVTTAINDLAGWSTTATFYVPFNAPLDAESVVAGSTVRLIELASKEDNPAIDSLDIATILASETKFAAQEDQPQGGIDYDARYVRLADGTDTIAITPLRPLDPITKYLVVVTDGLKDASGEAVGSSSEYELAASDAILPSPLLQPVRDAIQEWEGLAGSYLATVTGGQITKDNIILAYATTTDGSTNVLTRYANPELFVGDNLSVEAAEDAADSLAGGQLEDIIARAIAIRANGGTEEDAEDPQQLAAVTAEQIAAVKASPVYPNQVYAAISDFDLAPLLGGGEEKSLRDLAESPKARDVSLVNGALVDALIEVGTLDPAAQGAAAVAAITALGTAIATPGGDVAAVVDGIVTGTQTVGASPAKFGAGTSTSTRYYQGQIELPNFLPSVELTPAGGIPTETLAADASWVANTTVGAVLDTVLGQEAGTTPPKDDDGSTNVTYRYPLPQPVGFNTAPLLITVPSADVCTDPVPVVIYVHGITGSRGNGVPYSAALADNCIATVAIDQALHGIAPLTTNSDGAPIGNQLLPFHIEADVADDTGSPWAAAINQQNNSTVPGLFGDEISAAEQHSNIYQTGALVRKPIVYGGSAEGDSGSAFINLFNFARVRDNLRQSVVNLLNLNASLGNINAALQADSFSTTVEPAEFDLDKVYVAGHSLGAIVATTFVSVNNNALVQPVTVPVGPGVEVAVAGNTSLNKIQGAILANGGANLTKLLENSPSLSGRIVNGLAAAGVAQGSDSFEKFMFAFQSMLDGTDPAGSGIELDTAETPVLQFSMVGGNALPEEGTAAFDDISLPSAFKGTGKFLADHVVPNFDYFANVDDPRAQPYSLLLGVANPIETAFAPLAGTQGLAAVLESQAITSADVDGNPILLQPDPESGFNFEVRFGSGTHSTFANADDPATFVEMVTQSVAFIQNGVVPVTNEGLLENVGLGN